jgi:hypothetical protein
MIVIKRPARLDAALSGKGKLRMEIQGIKNGNDHPDTISFKYPDNIL